MKKLRKFANIRSSAFWILDLLKGGKVSKHIQEIGNTILKDDYQLALQKAKSQAMSLYHAVKASTPFYQNLPENLTFDQLPLINKGIIKEDYNAFINKRIDPNHQTIVTTSGSTGSPFKVYQDPIKRLRHTADNIFFNHLANSTIGEKLYYFRVWDLLVKKGNIKLFLQNVEALDASYLDCKTLENTFLAKLKSDTSAKSMLAYASTFEAIAYCIEKWKKSNIDISKFNVKGILSMSETLPEGAKKQLESFFQAPVISRYSNMENGFMAQQIPYGDGKYLLNVGSFFIEIFHPEKNIPLPIGEMGRIVVSDLYNYALPMLRYDTGDMGTLVVEEFMGKPTMFIKNIEGRKIDFIYATSGNLISPHVVTNTMWRYQDVKQFQLIQQQEKTFELILNIDGEDYPRKVELIKELQSFLGQDATITLKYVNEIPLLKSGKRKKIVNLMQPKI